MDYGLLRDYITGVMCKSLPAIDIPGANRSHQHEFQGSSPLKALLGDQDRRRIPARFIFLSDSVGPIVDDGSLSWYDARRGKPRRAEWRLYYTANKPITHANVGDTLTVALLKDGTIAVIITPKNSTVDAQIRWLFGIGDAHIRNYYVGANQRLRIDAVASDILDALGIDLIIPVDIDTHVDEMLRRYPTGLPKTVEFSAFCRSTLGDIDYAHGDPDEIVYAAYEREEMLFRAYERHEVEEKLKDSVASLDVDEHLKYAMSIFQRRKARAGKALENTLETIFRERGIHFKAQARTEHKESPDFLFPSEELYHNPAFPDEGLTMLGAKTTCKDRWRQVLSEAERIPQKHLVTLESAISEQQTDDMQSKGLQLVVPLPVQPTYSPRQISWLWSVADFIALVTEREETYFKDF